MTRSELILLRETIETVQAELETLEFDHQWFSSDCWDLLTASKELIEEKLQDV
jgi:hypothetical protein